MKRLIVFLAVAAALLAPSAALASGVVLKVQKASHLVAVARTPSNVVLVHTSARLVVGQRVALQARKLHNGTLAASSIKVLGRAHRVTFRGLVLSRSGGRLMVSAGGAVIALNRGRTTASATDSGPKPGTTIQVTATVGTSGELEEDGATTVSPTTPGGQIEGQLTLGTGTITVSSDQMSLVLKVPAGIDLTTFVNGGEVLATFTQAADGSLTLTALSADGNVQQADQQGGDGGSSNGSGGNGSGGSGDGGGGGSGGSDG